ncbi:hypothetical protein MM239_15935 [Belliella sp. DSM 111904]|uniref:Uncharacterized protein n=1 Tax=Belliella filtrata TaxID=2923435 RepID=A0ABS9V3G3_9BACT|nr:hypothetical protein [Belliella filtrata]MCH7410899.1 hypothetical protein [Belliella filtrata]
MNRNKIVFLILAVCFLMAMLWIGYDISTRTTFPGSKGNLKERITSGEADSLQVNKKEK